MENPINKFKVWWQEALINSPLKQKSAVCVSTIDAHGFPAGRFVDLKSVSEAGFVFCSHLDSDKGRQLLMNPKAAMTVWWDHVGYQVRVVGHAHLVNDSEANRIWETRNKNAQIVTMAFEQSAPLASKGDLSIRFQQASETFDGQTIPRPENWGAYLIKPVSIEFLNFKETRLHLRELYTCQNGSWLKQLLQP